MLLILNEMFMVEPGVGFYTSIENTQVIGFL